MTLTGGVALGIILCHLVGDYILQTDWMAQEKTTRWLPAILHGTTYTLPYILITQSPWALLVIWSTHIVIDRFRLIKYVIWAKNQVGPRKNRYSWAEGKDNAGYAKTTPVWLSTWLMIIADNSLHLLINTMAILIWP